MVETEIIIAAIIGVVVIGGALYLKKRMQPKKPKGNIYVTMVSNNGSGVPLLRMWPSPFESVEQIEAWWAKRNDLWEGVERIEISNKSKKRTLWQ